LRRRAWPRLAGRGWAVTDAPALEVGQIGELLHDAQDELARVLRRIDRRELTERQRQELVKWAGVLRINRGLSAHTCGNYVDYAAEWLEWLNAQGKGMDAATPLDVQAWVQALLFQSSGNTTRSIKLTAVRQFCRFRVSQEWTRDNPARDVPGPRRGKPQPAKFTTRQLQQMFASCDATTPLGRRDRAILLLFYCTGIRREEMVNLDLAQLVVSDRTARLQLTGKGNKERTIPFVGEAVRALVAWLTDRDAIPTDSSAVFLSVGNKPGHRLRLGGVEAVVTRAVARAKIKPDGKPMGCHRLRSTFATDLYDEGMRIEEIQLLMGHDSYETTRRYIAITQRQLKNHMPLARLNEVLGAQPPAYLKHTGPGRR